MLAQFEGLGGPDETAASGAPVEPGMADAGPVHRTPAGPSIAEAPPPAAPGSRDVAALPDPQPPPAPEGAAEAGTPDGATRRAKTTARISDITRAQYGAWMAERRTCPSCQSLNVAIDSELFGGLWCMDCRHEWRVTTLPAGADPLWWTERTGE